MCVCVCVCVFVSTVVVDTAIRHVFAGLDNGTMVASGSFVLLLSLAVDSYDCN